MTKLEIKKGTFKVRFAPGEPMTEATEGGVITLTDEEMEHWYTQAAIDEGRAVELSDDDSEDDGDQDAPEESGGSSETTLHMVQRSELEESESKLADETAKRKEAEKSLQLEEEAHTLATNKLADETQAREQAETKLADEVSAHNETKAELVAAKDKLESSGDDLAEEDLESKMLAVFPKLTDDDYKTDGSPLVKSVEALLGENVTADQVATAWAKFQEGQE